MCGARRCNDEMQCGACGLSWDVNDPEPPECPEDAQPEPLTVQHEFSGEFVCCPRGLSLRRQVLLYRAGGKSWAAVVDWAVHNDYTQDEVYRMNKELAKQ